MKCELRIVRNGLVVLMALLTWASAWSEAEPASSKASSKLPPGAVQAQANGKIEILPAVHSPLYVEFDRSDVLS